ncbi:peptide chain release factor N(5)-glutamine methyltransferase [Candidatus Riflebacteria bacterium]
MENKKTVKSALSWAKTRLQHLGLDESQASAEVLLARTTGLERFKLPLFAERKLKDEELELFTECIERRTRFEPVAYIIGEKEFFGKPFKIGKGCLIPRPETETLIEIILGLSLPKNPKDRYLDICTGCGIIALILADRFPGTFFAGDISYDALIWAKRNEQGCKRKIHWFCGDLFSCLKPDSLKSDGQNSLAFRFIVANPPYLSDKELELAQKDISAFEPRIALVSEEDGEQLTRLIIREAKQYLEPGGYLLIEGNPRLNSGLLAFGTEQDYLYAEILPDLGNQGRFLLFQKNFIN